MGVGTLSVVDRVAIFFFELGEFDRHGVVDGRAVTDGVADVVGEGADGEGEFVGGVGVVEEAENEVSGADVVGEFGEEGVAEGVVAEVLDGAAAVGVGVGLLELGFGEGGVLLEEDGADGLLPGEINQLFMGLDGVGDGGRCRQEKGEGSDRFDKSRTGRGGNRVPHFFFDALTLHTVQRVIG